MVSSSMPGVTGSHKGIRRPAVSGSSSFTYLSILSIVMMTLVPRTFSGLIDVRQYFPDLNGDLTKVIWAHAVNSQQKLKDAVEGSAMMLEADILMGTTPGTEEGPIMAHPPNTTSDLTFGGFLDTILLVNNEMKKKKGIKLDFKDFAAVEPVLMRLERELEAEKLNFPIWLNADVLKGPIDATKEPINGNQFIALAKRYLPTATLSLGWTTHYGRDEFRATERRGGDVSNLKTIKASKTGYTDQHVSEMVHLLRVTKWDGPVTFAVRAGLITPKESRTQLGRLMEETMLDDTTYTVWSVIDDPVNMRILKEWVHFAQQGNVYLDLPFDFEEGPVLIPDPSSERPLGRSDHLQSSSSSSTNVILPFLFIATLIAAIFHPLT